MKRNLYFLLFLFLLSCQTQNEEKKEVITDNTPNPNEQIVKSFFEAFNQHDWAKMAAMYADTASFRDPSFGTDIVKQTHVETVKKYSELQKVFPNVKDSVTAVYPSGKNHIVVEFVSTGASADGKMSFNLPICTVFTIENGKIKSDFTYYDNN